MAIRVAVIGMGARGRDWVRAIRQTPGHELVACVDVDGEAGERAAAELSVPPAQRFSELDAALAAARPDAVVVATPPDAHVEPCRAAIESGAAVLVEKPFALRLGEARRLVDLAERARVPLLVAQNYRYMRAHRTVRRVLESGVLGRVGVVSCQYFRDAHVVTPALAALRDCALWETAVHHVDALRVALRQPAVGVMAQSFTLPWSDGLSGTAAQVLLQFGGGARAVYTATYDSRGHELFERGQEFYQRISGEQGTLHVFQRWVVLCPRGRWPRLVHRGRRACPEEVTLLRQLECAMASGEAAECSGRDNLETIAVLEACARSAAEQRCIDPRELFGEPY